MYDNMCMGCVLRGFDSLCVQYCIKITEDDALEVQIKAAIGDDKPELLKEQEE